MAIEIVDLPINSMVIFHSYVTVYQRVTNGVSVVFVLSNTPCLKVQAFFPTDGAYFTLEKRPGQSRP